MIPLVRERTIEAINPKYRGKGKIKIEVELLKMKREYLRGKTKEIKFKSTYWKTARKQLKKESNGKCAYCEADTSVVAHGDVEHYRPKSKYWWLAYTYDNYLYSCQICNQTHKSNNFSIGARNEMIGVLLKASTVDTKINLLAGSFSPDPLDIDANFKFSKFLKEHKKEKPFILNPYYDDPTEYFAYKVIEDKKEVIIVPKKAEYKEYVKAADDFLGINRIELKNLRFKIFKNFRAFKLAYKELTDATVKAETLNQLNDMISDSYTFAGMNRYFDSKL